MVFTNNWCNYIVICISSSTLSSQSKGPFSYLVGPTAGNRILKPPTGASLWRWCYSVPIRQSQSGPFLLSFQEVDAENSPSEHPSDSLHVRSASQGSQRPKPWETCSFPCWEETRRKMPPALLPYLQPEQWFFILSPGLCFPLMISNSWEHTQALIPYWLK